MSRRNLRVCVVNVLPSEQVGFLPWPLTSDADQGGASVSQRAATAQLRKQQWSLTGKGMCATNLHGIRATTKKERHVLSSSNFWPHLALNSKVIL